jgi:hypothetical protein
VDVAGTKWQYVVSPSGEPNARQFGAAMNYNRALADSGSTNDQPAFQATLNFCTFGNAFPDNGGALGCRVAFGPGAALICNRLIVWDRVVLDLKGATIKQCDADAATQNFITLGAPHIKNLYCVPNGSTALFGVHLGLHGVQRRNLR